MVQGLSGSGSSVCGNFAARVAAMLERRVSCRGLLTGDRAGFAGGSQRPARQFQGLIAGKHGGAGLVKPMLYYAAHAVEILAAARRRRSLTARSLTQLPR